MRYELTDHVWTCLNQQTAEERICFGLPLCRARNCSPFDAESFRRTDLFGARTSRLFLPSLLYCSFDAANAD
jgi:hypothetical protein